MSGGRATNHERVITPVTPLTPFPQHVPPVLPSYSDKDLPFTSVAQTNEPWGFAAAALSSTNVFLFESNRSDSSCSGGLEKASCGRLKGLQDGLSHFFAAAGGSRSRPSPDYNPSRRRKKPPPPPPIPNLIQPSPSSLVKSAVNSKWHELERRKLFNRGEGLVAEDRKRELIEQATSHQHPYQATPPIVKSSHASSLPERAGKSNTGPHPLPATSSQQHFSLHSFLRFYYILVIQFLRNLNITSKQCC
jgi:hypothetical protein